MPTAPDDCERVKGLQAQFRRALNARDWEALAVVDLAIREMLQELKDRSVQEEAVLEECMNLKKMHDHALRLCAGECERLRQLLKRHINYAEGRAAYMHVDSIGGR